MAVGDAAIVGLSAVVEISRSVGLTLGAMVDVEDCVGIAISRGVAPGDPDASSPHPMRVPSIKRLVNPRATCCEQPNDVLGIFQPPIMGLFGRAVRYLSSADYREESCRLPK